MSKYCTVQMFRNKAGVCGTVDIRIHAIRKRKCKEGKNAREFSFSFRIRFSKGPP